MDATVHRLLHRHGRTYAEELGVDLRRATPSGLWVVLVFSALSAVGRPDRAGQATRAVVVAGWTTPARLTRSTNEERSAALSVLGEPPLPVRAAAVLDELGRAVEVRWSGDLRRMRAVAAGDAGAAAGLLAVLPGVGPVGAEVFLREAQRCWPELGPYVGRRASAAARALRLPPTATGLAALVPAARMAALAVALVRTSAEGDDRALRPLR